MCEFLQALCKRFIIFSPCRVKKTRQQNSQKVLHTIFFSQSLAVLSFSVLLLPFSNTCFEFLTGGLIVVLANSVLLFSQHPSLSSLMISTTIKYSLFVALLLLFHTQTSMNLSQLLPGSIFAQALFPACCYLAEKRAWH